jgi:hypothetical protein
MAKVVRSVDAEPKTRLATQEAERRIRELPARGSSPRLSRFLKASFHALCSFIANKLSTAATLLSQPALSR